MVGFFSSEQPYRPNSAGKHTLFGRSDICMYWDTVPQYRCKIPLSPGVASTGQARGLCTAHTSRNTSASSFVSLCPSNIIVHRQCGEQTVREAWTSDLCHPHHPTRGCWGTWGQYQMFREERKGRILPTHGRIQVQGAGVRKQLQNVSRGVGVGVHTRTQTPSCLLQQLAQAPVSAQLLLGLAAPGNS